MIHRAFWASDSLQTAFGQCFHPFDDRIAATFFVVEEGEDQGYGRRYDQVFLKGHTAKSIPRNSRYFEERGKILRRVLH